MRTLVYLVLIVTAIAGPLLYLTVGRDARARTAAATSKYLADRAEVDALLRADRPPRDGVLRAAEAMLVERRTAVDALRTGVAITNADATDARLRELALGVGLDGPVVDSLFAGLNGPASSARRLVLASVLGGIDPTSRVERLHFASLPEPIRGVGLERWRVELTFLATLGSVVRTTEALCGGDERRVPATLVQLDLARTRMDEWARFAETFEQPPLRVQASFDVLVGRGGTP